MKHGRTPRLVALAAVLAVGAALGACAPSSSGDDPSAASDQTLTVGTLTDLTRPDGHILGAGAYPFLASVFDTLISYDDSLTAGPGLATDWSFSDDRLELTLQLRDDVVFHDGKEFTSADVEPNLERVRSPDLGNPQLALLSENVISVDTPDDDTAVLHLGHATNSVLDLLALMAIVDIDAVTDDEASVGTGPFAFDSWQPGQGYVLTRNDDYWGEAPGVAGVNVDILGDAQTLSVQLESGALDVALGLDNRNATRMADDDRYRVIESGTSGGYYITVDTSSAPFDDVTARQALSYAINRDRFGTDVLLGFGQPSPIPWGEDSPAYNTEQAGAYAFDLGKAEELFTEADLIGSTIEMTVSSSMPNLVAQATMLQADLASIGITLEVNTVEFAQWREQVISGTFADSVSGQYGYNFLAPGDLPQMALPFRAEGNPAKFETEEYATLVSELAQATDDADDLYHDYTQYLLDHSFIIPIALQTDIMVTQADVEGVGFMMAAYIDLGQASIAP